MTFLWIRLKTDKAEALGLCDDTGALDVLLHIPVDKGGFPRGMVPWKGRIIMTFLWIRLKADKAESLGLYGDTGALDMLLHVPVDKGGFPRGMVPWRRENNYDIVDPAQSRQS